MRATYENHPNKDVLPPIEVTIVAGRDEVAIRISDQGLLQLSIYAPLRTNVSIKVED